MLKFSAFKIWTKYPHFWRWFVNILVASVWGYYAYKGLMNLSTKSYLGLNIAMLLRNTSLTLLFLLRRPSRLTSQRLRDWFVAIAGTFITYLYTTRGNKPIFPSLVPTVYVVMVTAAFLSAIAVVSLGRSFGIVPANRGIKTKGLYAVVRHPIYSVYIMHDIGWNLNCFSGLNVCVFLLYCLLTYGRAKCEERLLRQDPAYQEYALKTRYMFLPGII
ncbi:isoprenylcysteine carboxylmethyltransferase family protein [candidate division KSB1 bacterium]|nr:isoprenylcysteine carboxylmethyltransferase family protein [candidate division KSB1 bacterium]